MYIQNDKNSVRYAAALYRAKQRKKNLKLKLCVFFSLLIPAFSSLLAVFLSRPV